jgi:hypothetical protein
MPLQSDREDVTKLLGPPPDESHNFGEYRLGTEKIIVEFARASEVEREYGERIPDGTVLSIRRMPERPFREADVLRQYKGLKRYRVTEERFEAFTILFDEHRGIVAQVIDGEVEWILYIAPLKNRGEYAALYSRDPQDYFLKPSVTHIYPRCELVVDKGEVTVGDSVGVKVRIINANEDKHSYSYMVKGGRIVGSGESVIWETTGMAPGLYEVTVLVRYEHGHGIECGAYISIRPARTK